MDCYGESDVAVSHTVAVIAGEYQSYTHSVKSSDTYLAASAGGTGAVVGYAQLHLGSHGDTLP